MEIIGQDFNIEEICFGHETEGHAFGYVIKNKFMESKTQEEISSIIWAHEDGFECAIKWIANYLAEYGIKIKLHDKILETSPKDSWYSGQIVHQFEKV